MHDIKQVALFVCACLYTFVSCVSCGTVVFGSRGGSHGQVSENWGVLSQGTQIFLLVLGGILAIASLYGLYRLCRWCKLDPRKAGQNVNNNTGIM